MSYFLELWSTADSEMAVEVLSFETSKARNDAYAERHPLNFDPPRSKQELRMAALALPASYWTQDAEPVWLSQTLKDLEDKS